MIIYDKLKEFEKKLNYKFKDINLLKLALTHKSYAHDKMFKGNDKYNERIEFLGDAILELVISEYLYLNKNILSEGDMTKKRAEIVCGKSLSEVFKQLDGDKYLFLGKCELSSSFVKSALLADAFESVIGAIYLDSNFSTVKGIILTLLKDKINDTLNNFNNVDYKTRLQELLQKNGNINMKYEMYNEEGPDHDKEFFVRLLYNGNEIGKGKGKSKKIAEQNAAKVAYDSLS